jgi:hypothetical protein
MLKPLQSFRRNDALGLWTSTKAESEKLPFLWSRHCALRLIHLEFELLHDESRNAFHHPLTRPLAAHVDIAVSRPGDPAAVRKFLINASQRLDFAIKARNGHFVIDPSNLKPELRERLRWKKPVNAVFDSPPPKGMEDAEVIVRNHPLVVALAEKILGGAFSTKSDGKFARSGAAFTDTIQTRTVVLLARIRYCLSTRRKQTQLCAEEIVTLAFHREGDKLAWSAPNDTNTLMLLEEVVPKGSISQQERVQQVRWAAECIEQATNELSAIADARAVELAASHERLRQQTGGTKVEVRAHHPPDVLGIYVLLPGGGRQ